MIDDPEQQTTPPPNKLILPAPPETPATPPTLTKPLGNLPPRQGMQVRPEWLIRRQSPPPPRSPLVRLRQLWQKDPAYKVLMVAVAVVMVAGLLLATLATRAFFNPNLAQLGSAGSQTPTGAAPTGTVDFRPVFPTPGGGKGSTSSSQPPMQSTPALQPTTQPQPGPTSGGLTVQITSIPTHVLDNSTVNVGVSTSQPGVTVRLSIRYDVSPFFGFAGPRVTDGNGFANIPWTINVFGGGRRAMAVVVAFATNQQGQQAQSHQVVVQITGSGG